MFDPLLGAVKEATNTGLRHAGIDARLGEIGAAIQVWICKQLLRILWSGTVKFD